MTLPEQQYIKSILHYDTITGILTWLPRPNNEWWNDNVAGKQAGTQRTNGYRQVSIGYNGTKRIYKEHRIIWLYMTGNEPTDTIDHINHIRSDNRWCNLQELSRADNTRKKPIGWVHPMKGKKQRRNHPTI
jgi:hypothetical protein